VNAGHVQYAVLHSYATRLSRSCPKSRDPVGVWRAEHTRCVTKGQCVGFGVSVDAGA
jgi:hypothetical protein